ncbi:MAG: hypothetical protein KC482_03795 [Dehalococcoidia bacterium]|nr:hypothetical protein [Dehalococcoidia bacterium]MCA9845204.1 hypothetical protein [Dehalococcoidia bacterium]MCA9852707.1 hypothetical protein [Dehalococcoidia bacterium]
MNTLFATHPRATSALLVLGILLAGAVLQLLNANPAASQTAELIAREVSEDPGLDPNAAVWAKAQPIDLQLSGQIGLYSAGGGSITSARAAAVHFEGAVYLRVEWDDPTMDDVTTRVEDFTDAVALEFPAKSASTVPSVCMGQADSGVNIWHWRADTQQASFDPDVVYPNAQVDEYPSRDDLWYPARYVGNPVATTANGPIQTLIAQAFGTLSPAGAQDVAGQGSYEGGKWAVVFSRPFAAAAEDQAEFASGTTTDMAVAIWNGSEGDRNGQKSTSTFVTLRLGSALAGGGGDNDGVIIALGLAVFFGVTALGIGLALYGYADSRRSS